MDKQLIVAMSIVITYIVGITVIPPPISATGGAGEISKLIMPMIDRAIGYLNEGNIPLAYEEIQTLKQELQDTFEVDEKE